MTERSRRAWRDVPESRRRIMRANRRKDTGPELAVRSLLHARGLRFRVDYPVRLEGGRVVRPDVAFPRHRVALYIDGCYWHGCPQHATRPATNVEYWDRKLRENRERDARHTACLQQQGWTVIRAWEHETPAEVVERVVASLGRLQRRSPFGAARGDQ